MATRRLGGIATSSSVPDNGGDHSGGGAGGYVDDVFSTYLYEGTASSMSVNNGIDLAGEGGLVWIKNRSTSADHHLGDTARGVSAAILHSNSTGQGTDYDAYGFTGFNSDGFTINGAGSVGLDASGNDYASWTFRKAPKFFDVVMYTGDGTSDREIPHSLDCEPGMVVIKRTDTNSPWTVVHRSLSSITNSYLYLNEEQNESIGNVLSGWSSTSFTIGAYNTPYSNESGGTYVAYLFAHDDSDESIIKCGSYTGNGNANGPEIDLGFEPQFLIVKRSDQAYEWGMFDNMRGLGTGADPLLQPSNADAEGFPSSYFSINANALQLLASK